MEIIFEILFDLAFEGSIEAISSKKVPKVIRYLLIFLIVGFISAIILMLLICGTMMIMGSSKVAGILFVALGIVFLVSAIHKARQIYLKHKDM